MEGQTAWLVVTLISMVFSAFFSGMEIAFVSSNKVQMEIDLSKGGFTSKLVGVFRRNADMFISTMLVGNNIMLVVYGMGIAKLIEPSLETISTNPAFVLITQTLISTCIILFAGEFFPKAIFRINPNDMLQAFAPLLYVTYVLLYPVSLLSSALSTGIMKIFRIKVENERIGLITTDELDAYLQENIETHEDENKTVEREVKIFQNALDFKNTRLRDCMVPRNELVAVDKNTTSRDKLSRLFTESGLSKILVFDGDIDNVIGYIHVCELFVPESDWKEHIKPVMFAPESMLAHTMMQNLLHEKKSIVVVIDEFGGTSGFVTLEDLVEEIFGEIEDEHDRKRNKLVARQVSEGVFEFSGRMEVERINEDFHLDIPESDDYQTIAGCLLHSTEAIPEEGESFEIDGYIFTVLKKTAAKIGLIRLQKVEEIGNKTEK